MGECGEHNKDSQTAVSPQAAIPLTEPPSAAPAAVCAISTQIPATQKVGWHVTPGSCCVLQGSGLARLATPSALPLSGAPPGEPSPAFLQEESTSQLRQLGQVTSTIGEPSWSEERSACAK